jgi:hypothetical protein
VKQRQSPARRGRFPIELALGAILREPPLRALIWPLVYLGPFSARTRAVWGAAPYPAYLVGTLAAAEQALSQGLDAVSVIEFGVASGRGLLALEKHAAAVEKETGVRISVFGFDFGTGLPDLLPDYRDHPDHWLPGDFKMTDEAALRRQLGSRTSLILGDIAETGPRFLAEGHPPIGFASIDVDLYSSARAVLKMFSGPRRRMLRRTVLYFDDIMAFPYHAYAGERLAISEFNAANEDVKIDVWHGIEQARPFPERFWYRQLFIAHDLAAISKARPQRANAVL